jgi:hypothetical protein
MAINLSKSDRLTTQTGFKIIAKKNQLKILITVCCFMYSGLVFNQNLDNLVRKAEINKLKQENYPKNEFYLGLNLNSNFGAVNTTESTILVSSATMELDNLIPSYRLGFKYLLNPEKHHGFFLQYNGYSKKSFQFSENADFSPAFSGSFSEIQAGIVYGRVQFGYGRVLKEQVVLEENDVSKSYNLNSINLQYTWFRSNKLRTPKSIKDYWTSTIGFNYLTNFDDLDYTSFSIGLNYHFTFNRKLSLENKIWLKKRTLDK